MQADNALIVTCVKQNTAASRHGQPAPFIVSDIVYLSTKNINLPKTKSHNLALCYIGPSKILQGFEVVKHTTPELELSGELKAQGIHAIFHTEKCFKSRCQMMIAASLAEISISFSLNM
jgi:hypothetical protein